MDTRKKKRGIINKERKPPGMTESCFFENWLLPVVTAAGSVVVSTLVVYGVWKFKVSPVEFENQQLKLENQGLTRELAVAERWKDFYLGAYSRERDAHAREEAQSSIIRERLKALERENKLRVSETEGSSSALQERSKPAEIELFDKENSGLDTDTAVDLGSSFCPLETYISEIDHVGAIFDIFSWAWLIWTAIFLLLSFRGVGNVFSSLISSVA